MTVITETRTKQPPEADVQQPKELKPKGDGADPTGDGITPDTSVTDQNAAAQKKLRLTLDQTGHRRSQRVISSIIHAGRR